MAAKKECRSEDETDWPKELIEVDGTRSRNHLKKTQWDCVKE